MNEFCHVVIPESFGACTACNLKKAGRTAKTGSKELTLVKSRRNLQISKLLIRRRFEFEVHVTYPLN